METCTQSSWRRVGSSTLVALGLALAPAVTFAQPEPTPVAAPAPAYRLAFSGRAAVGKVDWGTELGSISELGGRVQVLPWLGVGLSYLQLNAGDNEGYAPFKVHAVEVSAAWRPVVGKWFDPFVQVGALGVVGSEGGYMGVETTSRFGLDGMVGIDLVRLPFAVGAHARSGFTSGAWTLLGLHLEVRV